MMTAKLLESGTNQTVLLPQEYRFSGDEVAVYKIEDIVLLMPKEKQMDRIFERPDAFSDGFMGNEK